MLSEYLTLLTDVEGMTGLSAAYVRSHDGKALIPGGQGIQYLRRSCPCCKTWIAVGHSAGGGLDVVARILMVGF